MARVLGALPGPFDVVVSCCMLTQLQLVVLDVVNDRHPAFDALRALTNAIHVRVLAGLARPRRPGAAGDGCDVGLDVPARRA